MKQKRCFWHASVLHKCFGIFICRPDNAVKAQLWLELNGYSTGVFVQEIVDLLNFVVPHCRGNFHVVGTAITLIHALQMEEHAVVHTPLHAFPDYFNHMFKDLVPADSAQREGMQFLIRWWLNIFSLANATLHHNVLAFSKYQPTAGFRVQGLRVRV